MAITDKQTRLAQWIRVGEKIKDANGQFRKITHTRQVHGDIFFYFNKGLSEYRFCNRTDTVEVRSGYDQGVMLEPKADDPDNTMPRFA